MVNLPQENLLFSHRLLFFQRVLKLVLGTLEIPNHHVERITKLLDLVIRLQCDASIQRARRDGLRVTLQHTDRLSDLLSEEERNECAEDND